MRLGTPMAGYPGYRLAYLFAEDVPLLAGLVDACRDYYAQMGEVPDGLAMATEIFAIPPDDRGFGHKFVFGVFDPEDRLVGTTCVLWDVPMPGEWVVGLMLIRPDQRGHGLGSAILERIETMARAAGAHHVRVLVAKHQRRAVAFWRRAGFQDFFESKGLKHGNTSFTGLVMRHELPPRGPALPGGIFPIRDRIPALRWV